MQPTKNPTIGIIGGRGTLGQIFKQAFETAGCEVLISGRKPDGKTVLSNKTLVQKADIVIITVFLKDTLAVIAEIAPLLNKKQLLCDFTSLKTEPVRAMLQSKAEVVGLHPMFGAVKSLEGKNIFACPVRSKRWWPWLKKTLQNFGLNVHTISPDRHDELAAIHQSTTHLISISLAELLKKRGIKAQDLFAISSPSTQLALLTAGRLLAQDHEMYADIQLQNPHTLATLNDFEDIFSELTARIATKDRPAFLKELQAAARHFGAWKDFAAEKTNEIFHDFSGAEKTVPSSMTKFVTTFKEKIAIMGPATQTELAAEEFLRKNKLSLSPLWCRSNGAVFEKVAKNQATLGIIPLENYTVGPVRETVKHLFEANGKIHIVAELSRPIAHALLGQKKLPANKVERIFAHPQARAQCQKFLEKNFPRVEIVETASTGESIIRASTDPNALAIGPVEAAKSYNLKPITYNLEDDPNNRTRFVVISKKALKFKAEKTALAFFFPVNKAGQLAAALKIFAEHKINLSRLESIPTEKKRGEFFFFTECEAIDTNTAFKKTITELGKVAKVINLGSY